MMCTYGEGRDGKVGERASAQRAGQQVVSTSTDATVYFDSNPCTRWAGHNLKTIDLSGPRRRGAGRAPGGFAASGPTSDRQLDDPRSTPPSTRPRRNCSH